MTGVVVTGSAWTILFLLSVTVALAVHCWRLSLHLRNVVQGHPTSEQQSSRIGAEGEGERVVREDALCKGVAGIESGCAASPGSIAECDEPMSLERLVFVNSSDVIIIVRLGSDGRFVIENLNPAATEAIGFGTVDALGISLDDAGPATDRHVSERAVTSLRSACEHCAESGMPYEYEGALEFRSAGSERLFHLRLLPLAGDNGIEYIIVIGYDITERRVLQEQLSNREKEYRDLLENAPDPILRVDKNALLLYGNDAAMAQFGRNTVLPFEVKNLIYRTFASKGRQVGELELTDEVGSIRCFQAQLAPEQNSAGEVKSVLLILRDISWLKETEKHLIASRTQLEELAKHRELAREQERRRIAREIHEELGQLLTALHMGVSVLSLQYGDHLPELKKTTTGLLNLIDRTISSMRNFVTFLRPTALDTGIVGGLVWLVEHASSVSRLRPYLHVPDVEVSMSDEMATGVFRIAQEALTNIIRHANASRVGIRLQLASGLWELSIVDDGVGFDTQVVRKDRFGLLGIRERAAALCGNVEISSFPYEGTSIRVKFPGS